ncbi:hypothetical protein NESM_000217900 [Novymonas esmeraldas]|uniref:Uncharacterized protein n=1 Tax=Novymonas esmeraldas TaxID=1808958 RepID=A0AAW0F9F6_9TRYP
MGAGSSADAHGRPDSSKSNSSTTLEFSNAHSLSLSATQQLPQTTAKHANTRANARAKIDVGRRPPTSAVALPHAPSPPTAAGRSGRRKNTGVEGGPAAAASPPRPGGTAAPLHSLEVSPESSREAGSHRRTKSKGKSGHSHTARHASRRASRAGTPDSITSTDEQRKISRSRPSRDGHRRRPSRLSRIGSMANIAAAADAASMSSDSCGSMEDDGREKKKSVAAQRAPGQRRMSKRETEDLLPPLVGKPEVRLPTRAKQSSAPRPAKATAPAPLTAVGGDPQRPPSALPTLVPSVSPRTPRPGGATSPSPSVRSHEMDMSSWYEHTVTSSVSDDERRSSIDEGDYGMFLIDDPRSDRPASAQPSNTVPAPPPTAAPPAKVPAPATTKHPVGTAAPPTPAAGAATPKATTTTTTPKATTTATTPKSVSTPPSDSRAAAAATAAATTAFAAAVAPASSTVVPSTPFTVPPPEPEDENADDDAVSTTSSFASYRASKKRRSLASSRSRRGSFVSFGGEIRMV